MRSISFEGCESLPNGLSHYVFPMTVQHLNLPVSQLRVLVVNSDQRSQREMIALLETRHMDVVAATAPIEAVRCLNDNHPDVAILDFALCAEDDFNLLRIVRKSPSVRAVLISGHCCDEVDRIIGFEMGADDFIASSCSMRELLARLRAILRRQKRIYPGLERNEIFQFGGWRLNSRLRCLFDPVGAAVNLSKVEFALLLAFVQSPLRPLSREHLLNATRLHEDIFDRSVDVQVLRLRRKIEADPRCPRIIITEKGIGYRFALNVETT
jgi:two-component system, OmpR family, response regulator